MKKLCCLVLLTLTAQIFSMNVGSCFDAVKNDDVEFFEKNFNAIKEMLKKKESHNTYLNTKNGLLNLLNYTISYKNIKIITFLIDAGLDLMNFFNRGALYYAVKHESKEIIALLLEKSMNPYMPDNNSITSAFECAIVKNKLEYVKLFVEADKKNDYDRCYDPNFDSYVSPYLLAQRGDRDEIIKYLAENGEADKHPYYRAVKVYLR